MLRKFFLTSIVFLVFLQKNIAQEFEKAPLANVKKIVEWTQVSNEKKVKKGITYHFNSKGLLTKYEREGEKGLDGEGERGVFKYDKINRIQSKNTIYGINKTKVTYAYQKKYYVEEIVYKDSYYKNFYYVDKNLNVLEMKSFVKNFDSNFKLQLFERIVYTYDKKGRLMGSRHYNHMNLRNKNAKPIVHESIYYYGGNGKVRQFSELNTKNKINRVTDFFYNKKNNLAKKVLDKKNGETEITTYQYKNGKIWMEKFDEGNVVITKIFKKGKLIRKRKKWKGGKEEIIDFQYSFYK